MKIGLFTDSYFPQVSGVATSIKTLKEALEKRGHVVYIFTTTDPNTTTIDKHIIRMPSVPFVSFKDRRIVIRGMLSAYYIAKELELDLIHTQTEFGVGILGKMVANQMNIPCIHTYHTMYEDYLHYIAKGKILRPTHVKMFMRVFAHHLSGIVCPSLRVVDSLRSYGVKSPLRVIPTGIDLEKFQDPKTKDPKKIKELRENLGYSDDQVLLLSLSRLSYEKNIQEVIHGFKEIHEKIPEARLLIVGKGPYEEELQALSEELGLKEWVTFTGEVDNSQVPFYYRAADFFVSCSTSESQGLTYTEAMACEVQCIVCGNDYIDTLFDDLSLGKTFQEPKDFVATFLAYYEEKPEKDSHYLEEKLYAMSSDKFAEDILEFYDAAFDYYRTEIEEGKPTYLGVAAGKLLRKKDEEDNF